MNHLGRSPHIFFSRQWTFRGKSEKASSLYPQGCDVGCPKPWLRTLQGSSNTPRQVHPWVICDLHFGKQANLGGIPKNAVPFHSTMPRTSASLPPPEFPLVPHVLSTHAC